jgi:hypothetical protein
MKIGIVGARKIKDKGAVVEKFLELLSRFSKEGHNVSNITWLVGGAQGASRAVEDFLLEENADVVLFKPWHFVDNSMDFSTRLFYLRNKQIVSNSDAIIVFTSEGRDDEVDNTVRLADTLGVGIIKIPL